MPSLPQPFDDPNMILLDPKIRDWVLLPIFVVMFLQGILRQYVGVVWLTDEPKSQLANVQRNLLLRRSARLRQHAHFLPASAYRMRKQYFVQKAFQSTDSKDGNSDTEKASQSGAGANPMGDPFAMVGMMKQNMAMIVPNMLLMGWVSYFFSGFVLVKLPFGLYERFKAMLQRGIFLRSLDPSYVSSLSWYFLVLFGMRGLFSLVGADGGALSESKLMEMQMTGGPAGMQPTDPQQLFNVERTELEILQHEWIVPDAEDRVIATALASEKKSHQL